MIELLLRYIVVRIDLELMLLRDRFLSDNSLKCTIFILMQDLKVSDSFFLISLFKAALMFQVLLVVHGLVWQLADIVRYLILEERIINLAWLELFVYNFESV